MLGNCVGLFIKVVYQHEYFEYYLTSARIYLLHCKWKGTTLLCEELNIIKQSSAQDLKELWEYAMSFENNWVFNDVSWTWQLDNTKMQVNFHFNKTPKMDHDTPLHNSWIASAFSAPQTMNATLESGVASEWWMNWVIEIYFAFHRE